LSLTRRIATQIDDPAAKRGYVQGLFAGIAGRYDLMNDVMSLGRHRAWKRRVLEVADLRPGQRVLDLAAGTGDLARSAREAVGPSLDVVATDLTVEMLQVGLRRPGPPIRGWIAGDAASLPYPDASFDRVLVGYGLRNFADLKGALVEILRCLAPGGRLVSLDFGQPSNGALRRGYLSYLDVSTRLLGWAIQRNAEAYAYIPESLRRFPGQRGVRRLMEECGYEACGALNLLLGMMGVNYGDRPGS